MTKVSTRCIRLIAVGMCLFAVTAAVPAAEKDDEYYDLMRVFVDAFEQIDRSYVKDVDRRELIEAAIQGMLNNLDQYSSYISPDDLKRFKEDVDQQFGGIGIQVNIDPQTKMLTVMTPLPGTPAYKGGVRAGDVIMEIEGKSTRDFRIEDAVRLLKGKPGEKVTIGVRHLGSTEIEQIDLVRAVIQLATVLGDRYRPDSSWNHWVDEENKIGYIRLTHFSRRSTDELRTVLNMLTKEGMKGLVLDLRTNPGGLLSQATRIADLFIESGKIVSTKGRNTPERVWKAKKPGTFSGFPLAILVNRYSASASEILSACLQDHKRAIIVGERTWGKGSVQNVINLDNGSSAMKLTTATYHRPSGKNIHRPEDPEEAKNSDEWGVMPDEGYRVRFTDEQMHAYAVYRRQRDVISKDGPPESDFKDLQRAKAVAYLMKQIGLDDAAEKKPEPAKKDVGKVKETSTSATLRRKLEELKRALRTRPQKRQVHIGTAA